MHFIVSFDPRRWRQVEKCEGLDSEGRGEAARGYKEGRGGEMSVIESLSGA